MFLAALDGLYHHTFTSEELRSELVDDFPALPSVLPTALLASAMLSRNASAYLSGLSQGPSSALLCKKTVLYSSSPSSSSHPNGEQRAEGGGDKECRSRGSVTANHHPHCGRCSRPNLVRHADGCSVPTEPRAQRVVLPHVVRKTRTPYEVEAALAGLSVPPRRVRRQIRIRSFVHGSQCGVGQRTFDCRGAHMPCASRQ